jgi:toxin-antitoxin system PIN domain toxin
VLIPDVNVLVQANQSDAVQHQELRAWLEHALVGREPVGVYPGLLASCIRIVTNHRLWPQPASPQEALDFCGAVLARPACVSIVPGARHWAIFDDLVREVGVRANVIPDAYLAALALENDATLVTMDRGFARFPGLRLLDPLAA